MDDVSSNSDFDEDDMYGLDPTMEIVSESSSDGDAIQILEEEQIEAVRYSMSLTVIYLLTQCRMKVS